MITLVAGCLTVAACSRGDRHDGGDRGEQPAAEPASATTTPSMAPAEEESLAAGDVRIVTTNGGIDLALIGDSISSGLSPEALRKVREETDTAKVHGTGFGADIEKMVKGTVQGAVGKRMAFPLSEVRAARYDGVVPIGDLPPQAVTALLSEIHRHRSSEDRFDVAVASWTASGTPAEYEAAGATWWLEAFQPDTPLETAQRAVERGPQHTSGG